MNIEFQKFGKIARLNRECVVTEKIDGTNAQISILPINKHTNIVDDFRERGWAVINNGDFIYGIMPGSRNRWITTKKDNYGFAKWVLENSDELLKLGAGHHFGEWWGQGIQRNYGMEEKVFSLFNVSRWVDSNLMPDLKKDDKREHCPACCRVVPILYKGMFNTAFIENELMRLREYGNIAVPGFANPEGIVTFHTASGKLFKTTLENDGIPKSLVKE